MQRLKKHMPVERKLPAKGSCIPSHYGAKRLKDSTKRIILFSPKVNSKPDITNILQASDIS